VRCSALPPHARGGSANGWDARSPDVVELRAYAPESMLRFVVAVYQQVEPHGLPFAGKSASTSGPTNTVTND
jgi:hypothetical protein